MHKKIIWVTSYPKSGNTWLRSILSSLFYSSDGKFNFELLQYIKHFDSPENYLFVKKINKNDYENLSKIKVISKYRIQAQEKLITKKNFIFFKTHSANVSLNNHQYTNEKNSFGLIYIVRDPRDIVISYSKYQNISIDRAIEKITNKTVIEYSGFKNNDKFPSLITNKLPYIMSSWDVNFISWERLDSPQLFIKYEDLINDPLLIINKITTFFQNKIKIEIENLDSKIENIVNTTNFQFLKKQEQKYGFSESTTHSNFFRKGTSNQWKKILTKKQAERIEKAFKPLMKRLGYIT